MTAAVQPGDVGFSRDKVSFPAPEWWIRFAESRKYGDGRSVTAPAHWNHAWLVIDAAGTILEATPQGIVENNVSEYQTSKTQECVILRPRYQAVQLAVQAMKRMQGQPYAFGSIFSDAMSLLFNSKLRIGFIGHHTCSGAVAHALVCGGAVDLDYEEWASPADVFSALRTVNAEVV